MSILALAFALVIAALLVFQICLAAGAPWGEFAWGGRVAGVLPTPLRVGSAVSAGVLAAFAGVMLDRAGAIDVLSANAARVSAWVVVAFLVLSALGNAASRSDRERIVMTPVALTLAVLGTLIALS